MAESWCLGRGRKGPGIPSAGTGSWRLGSMNGICSVQILALGSEAGRALERDTQDGKWAEELHPEKA